MLGTVEILASPEAFDINFNTSPVLKVPLDNVNVPDNSKALSRVILPELFDVPLFKVKFFNLFVDPGVV